MSAEDRGQVSPWRILWTTMFPALAILVLGGAALLGSRTAAFVESPKVCSTCHAIRPEFLTWSLSAHSSVTCTRCHGQVNLVKHTYLYVYKKYQYPIEAKAFPGEEVCRRCHTPDRMVTAPMGVKVSHDGHLARGFKCMDCHSNLVHGKVAKKVQPEENGFLHFTTADAQPLAVEGGLVPMDQCSSCHNGKTAPKGCQTCHPGLKPPPGHNKPEFHGKQALRDIRSCHGCHEYNANRNYSNPPRGDGPAEVAQYTRQNTFCFNCHTKKPSSHAGNFVVEHRLPAKLNRQGCAVCHDDARPAPTKPAGKSSPGGISTPETAAAAKAPSQVFCDDCHKRVHPANWLVGHREPAKVQGTTQCFSCHGATTCRRCHSA